MWNHPSARGRGPPPRPKATGGGVDRRLRRWGDETLEAFWRAQYILGAHVPVWLTAVLIVGPIFLLFFNHCRTDNMLHPYAKTCQTRLVHKLIMLMTRPNTRHQNNKYITNNQRSKLRTAQQSALGPSSSMTNGVFYSQNNLQAPPRPPGVRFASSSQFTNHIKFVKLTDRGQ
jgi:hypothetical protein